MRINTKILIGSMSIVAVLGIGSCTPEVTCGTGTIEKDGECTAAGTPNHGNCGGGSTFNPATQQCEITQCGGASPCGICGPNTIPQTDATGHTTCVGMNSGPPPCDQELACPPADSGRQMICGRLIDTETSANVEGADLPDKVKISFYEALAFANNPATPPEFSVKPDICGRYVSVAPGKQGVSVPGTMFILIGTDDASVAFPGGDFITTGVAISGVGGDLAEGVHTYLTRKQTDVDWSTSAGLSGATFVEQGVLMSVFVNTNATAPKIPPYLGEPTSGVKITFADAVDTAKDYYFDDTDQVTRSMVGSGASTGANGSALFVQGALDNFGGTGPTGCTWPAALASTIANTVFVVERDGTCP